MKMFFDKKLVDVNSTCFKGKTALYYAINANFDENKEVIKLLLDNDANVNTKIENDITPIIRACELN